MDKREWKIKVKRKINRASLLSVTTLIIKWTKEIYHFNSLITYTYTHDDFAYQVLNNNVAKST